MAEMSEAIDSEMQCAATFTEQMEILHKRGLRPIGIYGPAWCDITKVIALRQMRREGLEITQLKESG